VVGTRVQQYVNLGRMRNQGFDMSLEFDKNINKDFWISARGNFTYNRTCDSRWMKMPSRFS